MKEKKNLYKINNLWFESFLSLSRNCFFIHVQLTYSLCLHSTFYSSILEYRLIQFNWIWTIFAIDSFSVFTHAPPYYHSISQNICLSTSTLTWKAFNFRQKLWQHRFFKEKMLFLSRLLMNPAIAEFITSTRINNTH